MADSFLAYQNPSTTDKKLDSESLTVGANIVERERIQVAGATDVATASVLNSNPITSAYGLSVRPIPYKSADLDSGVGTDTVPLTGLAVAASGGAAVITGDTTNGLDVDVTRVSGTVTVDGSGVTQPVSNAGLTELAAAINASSQMDVNIAAQGVNLTVNSHAVTNAGTFAVQESGAALTSLQLLDDVVGTDGATVPTKAFTVGGTDGTNLQTLKTDINGELQVDVLTLPTVTETNSGTIVTNTGNAATSLAVMDDWDNTASDGMSVSGDVAHDGVDAGEPVKMGAKAIAHGTNPTAVAANDRTDLYANRAGVPFVIGGHPNVVSLEAAYTTAQTDAAIVTIATGLKIVVTQIQALLDEATTVGVGLRVGFGATTTPTTTGVVITHPGMVPGSGTSRGSGEGILGIGADGEDLRITSEVPTTGSLRILVSYYTIES